ncbi:hypothetical protein ED733_003527 [Metarhizium rileyi]|uniref:Uncharacterized protein n=1 Tax=Metarhizium rileyi (strain RCEF 4871) TaxID=1649241 RepID=A0A5C6GDC1_METRR|nr:hypothetical protein ED733_003527 [Metarhizium rileyi]
MHFPTQNDTTATVFEISENKEGKRREFHRDPRRLARLASDLARPTGAAVLPDVTLLRRIGLRYVVAMVLSFHVTAASDCIDRGQIQFSAISAYATSTSLTAPGTYREHDLFCEH